MGLRIPARGARGRLPGVPPRDLDGGRAAAAGRGPGEPESVL
jgi:hypothetical protein